MSYTGYVWSLEFTCAAITVLKILKWFADAFNGKKLFA